MNDEVQKSPLPNWTYPVGVVPHIQPQDQKPLNKMINKMFKLKKLPRRGLRGRHKKPKFY